MRFLHEHFLVCFTMEGYVGWNLPPAGSLTLPVAGPIDFHESSQFVTLSPEMTLPYHWRAERCGAREVLVNLYPTAANPIATNDPLPGGSVLRSHIHTPPWCRYEDVLPPPTHFDWFTA